jgi:hypothetical protein
MIDACKESKFSQSIKVYGVELAMAICSYAHESINIRACGYSDNTCTRSIEYTNLQKSKRQKIQVINLTPAFAKLRKRKN